MKKIIYYFLGVLLLASSFDAVYAAEKVRLTNGEYLPIMSENLKHYGFGSHVITEAFAAVGVEVEYGFFPWNRAFVIAKNGVWDGSVFWTYTEDRAKYFYYSDPIFIGQTVFFHLKTTPFEWNTIDDLKKYRIAVSLGYSYGPEFTSAVESGKISVWTKPSDKENLQRILDGGSHIFPIDREVGLDTIKRLYPPEIANKFTFNKKPIVSYAFRLILTKKNPKNLLLMKRFNKGLEIIKASGRFEKFYEDAINGKYDK